MARLNIEERLDKLENNDSLTNGANKVTMPNKKGTIALISDLDDHNEDSEAHEDIRNTINRINKIIVSNLSTDTEAMGKATNSVQLNPNIEGTLAYKIKSMMKLV